MARSTAIGLALVVWAIVAHTQSSDRDIFIQAYPLCFEVYPDESTIEHKTCIEVSARYASGYDRDNLTAAVQRHIAEREAEQIRARRAEEAKERFRAERNRTLATKTLGLIVERWWLGGFGTVFLASVTLQNNSDGRMADFRVACQTYGSSGTALTSASGILYEALAPKERKTFEVNLGMVHPQTARANCTVTPGRP